MSDARPAGPDVGEALISARPLEEYRAMFDLSDADLDVSILDCPGGGASFTAEVTAAGGRVMAIDPAYDRPADEFGAHLLAEVDRGNRYAVENPERYVWGWFRDPGHHRELRRGGARRFAADYAPGSPRYRVARLPHLPFADGEFELTLSSHLLFTYSDRLDDEFHRRSLIEMARVTAGEVRTYPLVDIRAQPFPRMDELRSTLAAAGLESEIRVVPYEFQRGADRMLVARGAG